MDVITTCSIEVARALHGRDDVLLIDLRDIREFEREGARARSLAPSMHRAACWSSGSIRRRGTTSRCSASHSKRYVLFCAPGWHSALATQPVQQMGLDGVGHIACGFEAWKASGAPVADKGSKPG